MKKIFLLLMAVFSLFSYTAKAATLPGGSKLFIDASEYNWFNAEAHVALWVWGEGFDDQWIEVTNKVPGETNIYVITLPSGIGITGMKMIRKQSLPINWDKLWNKSNDIVPTSSTKNKLILNGWSGMTGSWDVYHFEETTTAANLASSTANSLINASSVTVSDTVTTDDLVSLKIALGANTTINSITIEGDIPTDWDEDYFSACSGNPTITVNADVTLTDGVDVNLPRKITMGSEKSISYTRNAYRDGGWETIILPFSVAAANLPTGFSFEKNTASDNGILTFETVTALDANTPYLMKWDGEPTDKADITFTGTVDAETTTAVNSVGDLKEIWQVETIQPSNESPYYILNSTGTSFVRVTNKAVTLKPYRACIYSSVSKAPAQFEVIHGKDNGTTGITNSNIVSTKIKGAVSSIQIESATAQEISIYTTQGVLVKKAKIEKGINTIEGIAKGLYIVAHQKVIVK
ncbi:MAG: hypothetical protein WCQ82_08490 [Bacteroidaceae bacterium]